MKLRLLIGIGIVSSLFSAITAAQCHQQQTLMVVDFPKNSSYFDSQQKNLLDKTITQIKQLNNGYVLLNYQFRQHSQTQKMQNYNLWLAQNRINRVKSYVAEQAVSAPIIVQMQTSSDAHKRQVNISWCKQ